MTKLHWLILLAVFAGAFLVVREIQNHHAKVIRERNNNYLLHTLPVGNF